MDFSLSKARNAVRLGGLLDQQQFTAHICDIPLNQISEDPFLTTQALQIKAYFTYDKSKVEKYFAVVKDLKFHELIKVWKKGDKYFLIDNYEYFLSLQDFYGKDATYPIKCLVVDNANLRFIKELSLRLQNITPSDSHVDRCLNIKLLQDIGLTQQEIRKIYGIKKAQSAEGRKFQRDYRIAKHSVILNRVIGVDSNSENISLIEKVERPKIVKATLNYKLADTVIGIIGDHEEYLRAFDKAYEDYLKKLRESAIHEDEQTKPIFSWSKFSRAKVEAIARRISRDGEKAAFNDDYLLGDKDIDDHRWGVDYNENTKDLSLQAIKLNLTDKSDSNLKQIVDFKYRAEKLVHSLNSYIGRVSPVRHGGKVRLTVIDADAVSGIDSGNSPKFEDPEYFEYVRKNKLLYYCNRDLLLKSLNLRPHNFGFGSSRANQESSYSAAFKNFSAWYEEYFLPRTGELHQQNQGGRKLYNIFISIKNYLAKRSQDEQNVYFGDFILDLFSIVFADVDVSRQHREARVQAVLNSDQDVKSALWDQINEALEKAGFTKDEVEAAARELLIKDQNRVLAAAQKLEHAIKKIDGEIDVADFPFKKFGSES